ncbi:MAG: dephospho-CoA kinase [Candidatus Omnitrophica bacterium]|nr:dephospho-CoA kinase [Candidatus Omnitrophota bacterium]
MKLGGPLVVGLTGCFGSGKSTVARLFREAGAAIVDADRLAHEALEPASPVFEAIKNEFPDVLNPGGDSINRAKLGAVVFADPERRRQLEVMIHPYVFSRMTQEILRTQAPLVVLEVPLLFETGYDVQCAKTIFVAAPEPLIEERLRAKGFTALEIEQRNAAQMSAAEKSKKADFIILNHSTIDQTREEVQRVLNALLPERKGA